MSDLSIVSYAGAPAARGTLGSRINRSLLIQIAIAVVTIVVVFAPIVPLLYQSFIDRPLYESDAVLTGKNYVNLLSSPTILEVFWNTTLVVVLTTVIAQVIGTVLAILIGRTDLPGRSFLGDLILLPMYLSSLVLAFGWFIAYGPSGYITAWFASSFGGAPWNLYSVAGMALIGGISQAPLAFLYCQAVRHRRHYLTLASSRPPEAVVPDRCGRCGVLRCRCFSLRSYRAAFSTRRRPWKVSRSR